MKCYWDNFADFTEEQFAQDAFFQQWVLKPDSENQEFWQIFLKKYPHQKDTVYRAWGKVWLTKALEPEVDGLSINEKEDLKESIFLKLDIDPNNDTESKAVVKINLRKVLYVAALFCGFAGIAAIIWNINIQEADKQIASIVRTTSPKHVETITLPDSSVVILNGGSSIKYNPDMASQLQREVFVTGNAYFNVKENKEQPFIVHANQIRIEVTGTEFNVDARTRATDVVLTEGNINISLPEKTALSEKTFLNAGEKFRLDTLRNTYITEKVNTELYTAAWKKHEWQFQETTLETVGNFIKEYYGVDVFFSNSHLKDLTITAVISVNDFQTLINILEKTLNINIQVKSQQLIIY